MRNVTILPGSESRYFEKELCRIEWVKTKPKRQFVGKCCMLSYFFLQMTSLKWHQVQFRIWMYSWSNLSEKKCSSGYKMERTPIPASHPRDTLFIVPSIGCLKYGDSPTTWMCMWTDPKLQSLSLTSSNRKIALENPIPFDQIRDNPNIHCVLA